MSYPADTQSYPVSSFAPQVPIHSVPSHFQYPPGQPLFVGQQPPGQQVFVGQQPVFVGQQSAPVPSQIVTPQQQLQAPLLSPEEKVAILTKLVLSTAGAIVSKVSREIQIIKYKTSPQTVKIPVQKIGIQNGVQTVYVTEHSHTTLVPEYEDIPVQVQEPRQLPNGQWTQVTVTVYKQRQAHTVEKTFVITGVPPNADPAEYGSEVGTTLSKEFIDAIVKHASSDIKNELTKAEAVVWGKTIPA